jgi:hypothetical protein
MNEILKNLNYETNDVRMAEITSPAHPPSQNETAKALEQWKGKFETLYFWLSKTELFKYKDINVLKQIFKICFKKRKLIVRILIPSFQTVATCFFELPYSSSIAYFS